MPPTCPPLPEALKTPVCTEGHSAAALLMNPNAKHKVAAFSQYSRPSLIPGNTSDLPELNKIKFMGHTIRTQTHRYTEWRSFEPATYTTDWSGVAIARELYDHAAGDAGEDRNLCFVGNQQDCGTNQGIATALAKQLKAGWRAALPPSALQ